MKRIILFGGSFDPIHNGHLEVAKNAIKELKADSLWFVLAKSNPFKDGHTSYEHRQIMIEKMIASYDKMELCTIERDLPDPSYTIDTVKVLKQQHPNVEFFWLIGSDQLDSLHKWKAFDELEKSITFCVYKRPGFDQKSDYINIPGSPVNISSTAIREGNSTQTHPNVLSYMMYNGLYLDSMTKHRMSAYRYEHTVSVANLAVALAKKHGVDASKAYLAAMTHDWCKEWDDVSLAVTMMNYPNVSVHKALYHGFAAADILSKRYFVRDKDVLRAVRSHVSGSSTSKLGMILYIADKCEPGRDYDTTPLLDLVKKNLKDGFLAVKASTKEYRK